MRGPVNTDIVLTVRREGREAFDVTITRDVIKIRRSAARSRATSATSAITTFNEQTEAGPGKRDREVQEGTRRAS